MPGCLCHRTRHRITAGRAVPSQEPPSPKTYFIFSFKVVLATPRRCCRLPWTSGLCVLSTTDVSFSPLIPPLGPKQVQALPARISVSSLLSRCVAAPPCQCHPRLALPSLPRLPWLVGELSPLLHPGKGPVPAESPRCWHVGVLRWQLSPSEMADSSLSSPAAWWVFSLLLPAFAVAYAGVWGRQSAPVLWMALSVTLPSAHSSSQITTGCQRNYVIWSSSFCSLAGQQLCAGLSRSAKASSAWPGLKQELGMWPALNCCPHPLRQSPSPEPAWKPGPLGAPQAEQRVLLAPGPCTAWARGTKPFCINRGGTGGC